MGTLEQGMLLKVGILTLHYSNNNYGAVLQAYSIYKLVEYLGYEPYIINYQPQSHNTKELLASFLRTILGVNFERFRRYYIRRIPERAINIEKLKELNRSFDCFLVGSDQVWRIREDESVLYTYFLNFVEDKKIKIAYGASFGLDEWTGNKENTNKIQNLLNQFNSISVREETGVNICRQTFNIDSSLVLDPTLVVDKEYFLKTLNPYPSEIKNKSNYIAYMLLDDRDDIRKFFIQLSKEENLKFLNIKGIPIIPKKGFYFFHKISKWLYLIRNSELVVTDSYHCTVFSILFHKKFICLVNNRRGTTRMQNILKLIGEESRLCKDVNHLDKDILNRKIDYDRVDNILENKRKQSLEFLRFHLSKLK